jgi:mycofactocin system glycosyltransferase
MAGSPLTYFSVSDAGALIFDAIEHGDALTTGHESLTSRLLATGAAHPRPTESVRTDDITVVIPAYITTHLALEHLREIMQSLMEFTVIVVDDCSPLTISLDSGTVIRLEVNNGPGAARNAGLAQVSTPFVAFIDTDISISHGQLIELTNYLSVENVAVVAPRIVTTNEKTFISEYEFFHSPLDLGDVEAVVRPMSRVSYVPSAVLVGRVDSFKTLNGFNEEMRSGEDVDLVWRLIESGELCRYVPLVQCAHQPRPSIFALLKQRYSYGTSAAQLDKQHPHSASPFRANLFFTLPAIAILMGYLFLAVPLIFLSAIYVLWSLRSLPLPMRSKFAITGIGLRSTLTLLTRAIHRAWWPLFLVASIVYLRIGAMLTFSVLIPPCIGLLRNKPQFPIRYLAIRILDNFAYGVGVWVGAWRARSARCLVPVLTVRRSSAH